MPEEIATQTAEQSVAPAPEPEIEVVSSTSQQPETQESAPEETTQEEPQTTEQAEPEPEEEPRVKLSELTQQRKLKQQAEANAEYWRGRAEQTEPAQGAPQQPTKLPGEPALENYETLDEYQVALTDFRVDLKFAQQTQVKAQANFDSKLKEAEAKSPGLIAKINTSNFPASEDIRAAIRESDVSVELATYLADNQQVSTQLANMPIKNAMRRIGRIEAELNTTPKKVETKKISQAPEPPNKPVSGTNASVRKNLDEMSMEEFAAHRNQQENAKRQGKA